MSGTALTPGRRCEPHGRRAGAVGRRGYKLKYEKL